MADAESKRVAFCAAVKSVLQLAPGQLADRGDEVFQKLRHVCVADRPGVETLEQEKDKSEQVWRFLVDFAEHNRNKFKRITEVINCLKKSPGWVAALERFRGKPNLAADVGGLFGLLDNADEPYSPTLCSREDRIASASSRDEIEQVIQCDDDFEKELRSLRDDELFTVGPECQLRPKQDRLTREDSYLWVRRDNGPRDRQERAMVASQTLVVAKKGAYIFNKRRMMLKSVRQMLVGTKLVCDTDLPDIRELRCTPSYSSHPAGVLADVALDRTRAGKNVAIVSAASAYSSGGGFLRGGRHALEESLCMQSTLYLSLLHAEDLAEAEKILPPDWIEYPERWRCHIPINGVIFSPAVEFFRAGSDAGYHFLDEVRSVSAVLSVSMPNCNPRMSDCPVDAPEDKLKYEQLLEVKCRAICVGAVVAKANCLVVPDAGCGVYGNSPSDVGAALGKVLREEFHSAFSEVHLVGSDEFVRAVESARNGSSRAPPTGRYMF